MKKSLIISLLCLLGTLSVVAQTTLKKVYNEEVNPLEQIDQAISQARNTDKFVVCQVGGNWCPWCLKFADFVAKDSTISKVIEDHFILIHINYNPRQAADQEKALQTAQMLQQLGNPARFGFPVFVVLDGNGKVVHIQDSSFLEEGSGYNRQKVLRFFECWTPKAVHSSPH